MKKNGIHPHKVGFIGFSAGSHLAAVTSLWKSDDPQENPDFSGYVYRMTSLTKINIERLETNLFHRKMTSDELVQYKLLDWVTKDSPPAFLVNAYDDDLVNIEESTLFAQKLNECKVPVEMHLFPKGGHGFGKG